MTSHFATWIIFFPPYLIKSDSNVQSMIRNYINHKVICSKCLQQQQQQQQICSAEFTPQLLIGGSFQGQRYPRSQSACVYMCGSVCCSVSSELPELLAFRTQWMTFEWPYSWTFNGLSWCSNGVDHKTGVVSLMDAEHTKCSHGIP